MGSAEAAKLVDRGLAHVAQRTLQGLHVFHVAAAIGQLNIEVAGLFAEGKVLRTMHRQREDRFVLGEDRRRTVALMNVQIDDGDPQGTAHTMAAGMFGLHQPGGHGGKAAGVADRLRRHLGVEPGSVTPFALVNDETRVVRLALDRGLADCGPINAHPLVNTMTTAIEIADLLRLFEATGHAPRWLDFPV